MTIIINHNFTGFKKYKLFLHFWWSEYWSPWAKVCVFRQGCNCWKLGRPMNWSFPFFEAACIPSLFPSAKARQVVLFLVLTLQLLLTYRDSCDSTGATQKIEDNLSIPRLAIRTTMHLCHIT
jgi:hypothetical protein